MTWGQRRFELQDLDEVFLCVVATSSKATNRTIFEAAQQRGSCATWYTTAHTAFYYPAVVRRGPLLVAISTAGHSGPVAKRLREELEIEFGPEWENWLRWLGQARPSLYDDALSPRQRRAMLQKLASRKMQEEVFRRWGVLPKTSR